MPELPEVETVAVTMRARIVGRRVESAWTSGLSLRRPVEVSELTRRVVGARFEAVDRVGKYLILRLDGGAALLCHLGMSGRFSVEDPEKERAAHTHVVLGITGEGAARRREEVRYVDPRRFGSMSVYASGSALAESAELSSLGPDPLTAAFDVAYLGAELSTSGRDVKQFLLDQTRIAGLGNIYVSEALHRAGISPRRRADRITGPRVERLHAAIVSVLRESVARRGTTLRDYLDVDGRGGDNRAYLGVYERAGEPCLVCGATIRHLVQGARSTYYCPRCQR